MDFLRLKQAGIHNDLTDLLSNEDLYVYDEIARYGLPGKITALAYDPVQSLLALGTGHTDDAGKVYIFGQGRVEVVFELARRCNVNELHFCSGRKLVVWDSSSEITVIGLAEGKILASYSPPGAVTAVATDPALDWAFLGLDNGDIICYDVDREALTPFRVKSTRTFGPKRRVSPVVSLATHPRDISTLLVAYKDAAATYKFSTTKSEFVKEFIFTLEPGAPGGDTDPSLVRTARHPHITSALWHPTGLFILTAHEDGCLAFWDPNHGKLIQARTVQDGDVHLPQGIPGYGNTGGTYPAREPFFQVSWVCGENPEDTAVLVSGGNYSGSSGITLLEYGVNPSTITSSYQTLSDYFATPKKHRVFPTPPHNPVIKFLPLPRDNPHYNRSHNPQAIICLLSDSSLTTLAYPSSVPIPGSIYHPSISLHHPITDGIHVSAVARPRWMVMKPLPPRESFIQGGAEFHHEKRRFENRLIGKSIHNEDGKIRIWDLGRKDEIENPNIIEVDVFAAAGRGAIKVEHVDMSESMGELVAALDTGEIIIWRWDRNRKIEPPEIMEGEEKPVISDIRYRANPGIRESLLPAYSIDERKQSKIVLLELSSVGFLVVGYADGSLTIVDLRQPRIMLSTNLSSGSGKPKRNSLLKSASAPSTPEVVTASEFSVFILDEAEYTSLNLHISTSHGKLYTYRILPREGVYYAEPVGTLSLSETVYKIAAIEPYRGTSVRANPDSVAALRDGIKTDGCLVAFAEDEVRICKPPTNKGAKEVFEGKDNKRCIRGNICELPNYGVVAVCVLSTGEVLSLSLPNLKQIVSLDLNKLGFDIKRLSELYVSGSGDLIGWLKDGRMGGINLWGEGDRMEKQRPSILINPNLVVPPRPTISNLQWLSGTQHLTADTLAELIFPSRPPPKHPPPSSHPPGPGGLTRTSTTATTSSQGPGVWESMQKGLEERTRNLNIVGDSMDRLGESAHNFTMEVDRMMRDAKKKAIWGGIKGKFF